MSIGSCSRDPKCLSRFLNRQTREKTELYDLSRCRILRGQFRDGFIQREQLIGSIMDRQIFIQ